MTKTQLSDGRKLIQLAHHRNGIYGRPFDVAIITEPNPDKPKKMRKMLVVYFPGDDIACAAFDLEKLAAEDIKFGSNSWRGDHYSEDMRTLNEEAND